MAKIHHWFFNRVSVISSILNSHVFILLFTAGFGVYICHSPLVSVTFLDKSVLYNTYYHHLIVIGPCLILPAHVVCVLLNIVLDDSRI